MQALLARYPRALPRDRARMLQAWARLAGGSATGGGRGAASAAEGRDHGRGTDVRSSSGSACCHGDGSADANAGAQAAAARCKSLSCHGRRSKRWGVSRSGPGVDGTSSASDGGLPTQGTAARATPLPETRRGPVPPGGAEVAEATSARVAQVQPAPRQAPGRGRQALHGSAGCKRGARRRMRWWRTRAAQPRGQGRPPAARRRGACWRCCCRAALRPSWTRASAGVRTCPGPVCGGLLRQEACPPLAAPAVCPAVSLLCHSCVCCVSPVVVSSVSHRALAVSDTARNKEEGVQADGAGEA